MTAPRLVLVHGAAVTPAVWREVVPHLAGFEVIAARRPCSGDLDTEVAALAAICAGAVVAGVSGGATLGLELAARGVPLRAAVLHEPAAGPLAPGLLAHVAEGLRTGGVAGFGRALYGPAWRPADAPAGAEAEAVVAREFAMFRAFEPAPPAPGCGPVLLTTGAHSPPPRHAAAAALAAHCGLPTALVPGAGHAAHLENPAAFAAAIRAHAAQAGAGPPRGPGGVPAAPADDGAPDRWP
ncbi:alpha/beta fold hydrolase [Streptomyces hoynatensis]|uniref:Alpha/beta fold hydrolase n=1 Tax=Streptomyces hoynatensis TaxID=1141874 RepID=A0A3A9Z9Q3_9ACTN|nr:alpha/beta fold hydrolase [Streptomyces hoynatensis]RKN44027.1 alpha/beta fold hydrolase [Streptomyces hoynatensis]